MKLKLGIIGLSPGNGHPYSWSAIFNGYDTAAMADCGFPVIPAYLEEQNWPEARIKNASVTHIWTQDLNLSIKVSQAGNIPNIVDNPLAMIKSIDALLLARDDALNHYELASPFLDAGVPVYIDKPIALSLSDLDRLYAHQRYDGQIFTASALRYSKEFQLSEQDRDRIGPVKLIRAIIPKAWDTYAIHLIDPVLNIIGHEGRFETLSRYDLGIGGRSLTVQRDDGVVLSFTATGHGISAPLRLSIHGVKATLDLDFNDSFSAFKSALQDFVDGVRFKSIRSNPAFNRACVAMIEMGR